MTPEVEAAIEEVKATFPGHRVEVEPDDQGGAYVVVHDVAVGERYTPSTTWVGFLIAFQYPHVDVYPHFIDGNLHRVDGRPHGNGFSGPTSWRGRQALQVSRRSPRWHPALDTAVGKLLKVVDWVKLQ